MQSPAKELQELKLSHCGTPDGFYRAPRFEVFTSCLPLVLRTMEAFNLKAIAKDTMVRTAKPAW